MPQQATATAPFPASLASRREGGAVVSIESARRRRPRQAFGDVIRVLVVGGHAITRAGLRRLLEEDVGLAVVGEAAAGCDGGQLVRSTAADVVILDAGCVDSQPAAATRMLGGRVPVLLLTECDGDDRLLAALRAGATGVLRKDSHPVELAFAVRTLAGGGALLPPHTIRWLLAELVNTPSPTPR